MKYRTRIKFGEHRQERKKNKHRGRKQEEQTPVTPGTNRQRGKKTDLNTQVRED